MKNKVKDIIKSPYFITLLFLFKMVVYYSLIEVNKMEVIITFVSLVVWGTIFLCFSQWKRKGKRIVFLLIYFGLSLLMFADTMYYNYYNQTVSVRQLWQAKSVAAVPKSFIETLIPASFLLFIDIPFVYYCFTKQESKKQEDSKKTRGIRYAAYILSAVLITMIVNPFQSAAFERVNNLEFFTSHVNDIYETIAENVAPDEMDEEEILEVIQETVVEVPEPKYHGIGKGKNLLVIQLEAFQDFVVGREYEGQEITPNINALIKNDTVYFNQYYSNIGKGNTVDAEFSTLNSLYPTISGESYRLYEQNAYMGLPWLLREQGYRAFAFHGFEGEFWNRQNAYPYQGFEEFYSMEDFDQDEIIGMGISDKSLFKQLMPKLKEQTGNFFAFGITLTNHHPYILDEEYVTIDLTEEYKEKKLGNYLTTVRYTDEAVGQLIADLKEAGLYDNTVIALYGDHHGLNSGMDDVNPDMTEYLGVPYDYDEMLNVPLIIHVPGSGAEETISTTGGQIDFLPTIANIMGLSLEDGPMILGQDLVNAEKGFVAFTSYLFEGSFVTDEIMFEISREGIFEGSRAWRLDTKEAVDASLYLEEYEMAMLRKQTSLEILNQNLMVEYINHEEEVAVFEPIIVEEE